MTSSTKKTPNHQESNKKVARVVVVSDLHVGSIYGLLPPEFRKSDDAGVYLNVGQKYLWECWLDFCGRVQPFEPDFIVLNGDVIDGKQRLQEGTESCLPDLADQADAAVLAMQSLLAACPQAELLAVKGTEYHDAKSGREMEAVAQQLRARRYDSTDAGRYAHQVLDLEIAFDHTPKTVVLNFLHGVSVSGGLYRSTAPDREGVWSALAGKEGKCPKADAVIRSHAHYFVEVRHASKLIMITPCWQLQTPYMRKNSAYRMLPDIGGVLLTIDPENPWAHTVKSDVYLYNLPPRKPTKVFV